jgi:hypothetical protein
VVTVRVLWTFWGRPQVTPVSLFPLLDKAQNAPETYHAKCIYLRKSAPLVTSFVSPLLSSSVIDFRQFRRKRLIEVCLAV